MSKGVRSSSISVRPRRVAAAVALVAVVLSASPSSAQPAAPPSAADETRSRARALGEEGNDLFDKGDYAGALDRYERAAKLVSVPTLGLKSARCLEKLHRLIEASERYLAVTRMTLPEGALDVHKEALIAADKERTELLPRIPSVVVKIRGEEAGEVSLDGKPYPAELVGVKGLVDPGKHRFEARRGRKRVAREVDVAEGAVAEVELDFANAELLPEKPRVVPSSPRWLNAVHGVGLAALGLGVAGLAVGAGAAGAAASSRSDLQGPCGEDLQCPPSSWDDADSYNTLRVVSTAGWIAGGVLAATGIVLVVLPTGTSKEGANEVHATWLPGGGAVTWRGSF